MHWHIKEDQTQPIITARAQITSKHGFSDTPMLPKTCIVFEMGMAMPYIEKNYPATIIIDKLPCFLTNPKCIQVQDISNACFTQGGYGAPAAVDTLEILSVLGVSTIIVVGMCGAFAPQVNVGDVIIPHRIASEEGTSWHYTDGAEYAYPDKALHDAAVGFYKSRHRVFTDATVTTDAVYRQTFQKESLWRQNGCIAVDMESSALLTVSRCKSIRAVSILVVSDRHPITAQDTGWNWGNSDFREIKQRFVDDAISFVCTIV